MKAISIQQPWAWAIFNGKPIENRTWSTAYRVPLLIHSSRRFDEDGCESFFDLCCTTGISVPHVDCYKYGGFIGIVDMVDCVQKHESPWFFGPYGFVFQNPRHIEFIPFRGKLGLFDVPETIVPNIKVRTCRVCGCTDDHACPGGCFWVESDLCSACATKEGRDK